MVVPLRVPEPDIPWLEAAFIGLVAGMLWRAAHSFVKAFLDARLGKR